MIFIINKRIKYNEHEGTLQDVDDVSNSILLAKPACRLLSIFVRNNENLVYRKQLLDEVWGDFGLKATDSNLNNYISGLRKTLASFNENDMIITYPRKGFKFSAENIIRQVISSEFRDENPTSKLLGDKKKNADTLWEIIKKALRFFRMNKITSFHIVAISLSSLCFFTFKYTQSPLTKLGSYKNCNIYTKGNVGSASRGIKNVISRYFTCDEKANIYYYVNVSGKDRQENTPLFTYCPLDISAPCEMVDIKNYK